LPLPTCVVRLPTRTLAEDAARRCGRRRLSISINAWTLQWLTSSLLSSGGSPLTLVSNGRRRSKKKEGDTWPDTGARCSRAPRRPSPFPCPSFAPVTMETHAHSPPPPATPSLAHWHQLVARSLYQYYCAGVSRWSNGIRVAPSESRP